MGSEREREATEHLELDLEELEEEAEAEASSIPDKPTDIAPGAVDYPGKNAPPKGSQGGASIKEAERGGKTGPKGGDYGAATQGG